ncbi:MAG TPA: molybdopterin-dependent oxidoreductase [Vicinamibacteria bacterium]|jgi:DMSO/TMAO reductase YedYZ molybdopterin-dependent catalytic subunit
MKRRRFVQSVLLAGAGAALPGRLLRAAGPKWILPTDTPDRHHLKVMAFNPIATPDPRAWELTIGGLVEEPRRLKVADLAHLPRITQSSRLKCVQCWSGRVLWEGFRCGELLKLARPKFEATFVRIDCADRYFDCVSMEDMLHPRTLFAVGMNGEPLTPEHGAPLRLVMPHKYGYRSSKLITKVTLVDTWCQGIVADAWPSYYSPTGAIEAGLDHPFDFPGEARKITGGEILDY